MKIREMCTCGAEIEVEQDDPEAARQDVKNWRETHRCAGPQPWRRSAQSTSDVRLDFGFGIGESDVMA